MAEQQTSPQAEKVHGSAMVGSLRGNEYQLLLTIAALIRAGISLKEQDGYQCSISAEDEEAGKFDDVVLQATVRGASYKLCVQAKNRMNGENVTQGELLDHKSKGAFSLSKYFQSFLEMKAIRAKNAATNQARQLLVLCTNVDVDEQIGRLLESFDLPQVLDIFGPLDGTCYRFSKEGMANAEVIKQLNDCSDCSSLVTLLVDIIYKKGVLDLNPNNKQRPETALMYKYSEPLRKLIGVKREKVNREKANPEKDTHKKDINKKDNHEKDIYELRDEFIEGYDSSTIEAQFRETFKTTYNAKYEVADVWQDVKDKGIRVINLEKDKKQEKRTPGSVCSQLPVTITRDDIEMFREQFIFVTNAKDLRTRMHTYLKNSQILGHIGEIESQAAVNHLYKVVHDWVTRQSGVLSATDDMLLDTTAVNHIWLESKLHLQYLKLKNLTTAYISALRLEKGYIKEERLLALPVCGFLKAKQAEGEEHPTVFTFLSCYETRISAMMLFETIDLCFGEADAPELLFVEAKKYTEHKRTLQDILCTLEVPLVLMIEWEEVSTTEYIKAEMMKAASQNSSPIPAKRVEKKVILIARTEVKDPASLASANSLLLEHFNEGSLEGLLPEYAGIKLFGTDTPLLYLAQPRDDVRILLDLTKGDNKTVIEQSLTDKHYQRIRPWYIERDFRVLPSLQDIEAVTYADDFKQFDIIEPSYDGTNNKVNWASFTTRFLLASFKMGSVRDVVRSEENAGRQPKYSMVPPPAISDATNATKAHIFLDEAGFGKTTYLSWMGGYLQSTYKSWWIIRFNSIDYSTDFKRLTEEEQRQPMDDARGLRILYQMIHLALFVRNIHQRSIDEIEQERELAKQSADLLTISSDGRVEIDEEKWKQGHLEPLQLITVRFFAKKFNERQLVVLFDGFDEVVPHYEQVAFDLLARFECFEGIRKMYITSRPYMLGDGFAGAFQNPTFYQLKPFADKDLLKAVHMFMQSHFKEYLTSTHVEYLLESLSCSIKHYLGTFSKVPLFITMALDVLKPTIAQHVDFIECTIDKAFGDTLKCDFEELSLIEKFFENKVAKANVEKIQLTDSASNISGARSNLKKLQKHALQTHSTLALYVVFDSAERARLPIDQQDTNEYMEEVNGGHENVGIIEAVVEEQPIFIHRTFAEYFAAYWLYKNRIHDKVQSFLKSYTFWGEGRRELRSFFDRMLIKESNRQPMHVAILDGSLVTIHQMIMNNPDAFLTLDAAGRTVLHLLVIRRKSDNMFMLPSSDAWDSNPSLIDQTDTLLHWSPLDYAFVGFDENAFIDLLELGATIDAERLVGIVLGNDAPTVVRKISEIATFLHKTANIRDDLKKAISDLLEILQRNTVNYMMNHGIDLHQPIISKATPYFTLKLTPLEYFVTKNDWGMFSALCNRGGGFGNVLSHRVNHFLLEAFQNRAFRVLDFFLVECRCEVPESITLEFLYRSLEDSIVNSLNDSFVTMFGVYCSRRELEPTAGHTAATRIVHESFCYVYNFVKQETMLNPAGVDGEVLGLLRTSLKSSNVTAVAKLLQFAPFELNQNTYPFIVAAMRECKLKNVGVHWECEGNLQHLIETTDDLHKLDEDGKTLLHIALETKCFHVAQYLIDEKAFPLQPGAKRNDGMHFSTV